MATGSESETDSGRALADKLHRLRSTLARLRGELELLELDGRPPGREAFIALNEAFEWLDRIEAASLGAPVRVVLVEDDSRLAELTAARLVRLGFEVECVADLASGVALLESRDRLVVDYGLLDEPMAPSLRAALGQHRPIVVSGAVAEAARERALALGATAYIVKPVDVYELARLLRMPAAEQP